MGIIGILLIGLIGAVIYGFYVAATSGKRQEAFFAQLRADELSGDKESVTVEWSPTKGGTQADLVKFANEQGYRLDSSLKEAGGKAVLTFEKRRSSALD